MAGWSASCRPGPTATVYAVSGASNVALTETSLSTAANAVEPGPALVKDTATAVQKLQKDGAQKLVVDVRDCGSGSPEDGIALANLFLKQGRITYLKGQKYPQKNFDADPAKAISSLPLAVLTNKWWGNGPTATLRCASPSRWTMAA